MGENMMHNDGCSQCTTTTTIEKPPELIYDKLYELYLEDGGQVYFRQLYHPFKQYNNMVHLGIGQVIAERNEKETLIAEHLEDIIPFIDLEDYKIIKKKWEAKL